jgi:predicted transcriptional regulator
MSRYSMHLREFVNTVHRNVVAFPRKEVSNYVDKNQVSVEEITNLFNDIYEQYQQ